MPAGPGGGNAGSAPPLPVVPGGWPKSPAAPSVRRRRLHGAIGKSNHPGFRVAAAVVLSGDGRGLGEALTPGVVSAIWTVADGTLDLPLRHSPVVALVLVAAREAAELHPQLVTGASVR